MHIKTTGITLKSTPFRDRTNIIQLLSKDLGIISVIVRGISKKNLNLMAICSPFAISEIVLKKTNSDIYKLKEGSLIDVNLHIRKSLKYLKTASYMIKAITSAHFLANSKDMYLLLKIYLKKIDLNPDAIYVSFLLKLLQKSASLHLNTKCNVCEKEAQLIEGGESLCIDHGSNMAFKFSKEDFKKLFILCFSKSFSLIENLEISNILKEKTNFLFKELM
ncbi:MAG: DNA repair protein RecO [Candidatus Anoxychlamydiales bacterium]|nr:DNA repair protein RecO [Candidatus Anoxychlamydiales bacterium]